MEINVRLKQSKFRNDVLKNFNHACCISNVTEKDLLVASHIIPWADKKETRLDPTNGLCLLAIYDKLFDKGYFTLTDDFRIKIIENRNHISKALIKILNKIDGKPINIPLKKIKQEYVNYHRENIYIDRLTINS